MNDAPCTMNDERYTMKPVGDMSICYVVRWLLMLLLMLLLMPPLMPLLMPPLMPLLMPLAGHHRSAARVEFCTQAAAGPGCFDTCRRHGRAANMPKRLQASRHCVANHNPLIHSALGKSVGLRGDPHRR
jgi:hypothetical protein